MNFIVYMPNWEPSKHLFDDLLLVNYVKAYDSLVNNVVLKRLYNSHIHGKLSFLPFKRFWAYFTKLRKAEIGEGDVVLYLGSNYVSEVADTGLYESLRKKGAEQVLFLLDVHAARRVDINLAKSLFDIIYIFDESESKRLMVDYYPVPFSAGPSSDVAFVGQDKGRLDLLLSIYERLHANGLRCAFYLVGVPKEKQVPLDGVMYGDFVDYNTSLNYILNTNCVLELRVGDVDSYSDRVQKAITFNKKVLTNNHHVKENPFFKDDMIRIFDTTDQIDIDFVRESTTRLKYDYDGEYSPINLLKRIEEDLSRGTENAKQ